MKAKSAKESEVIMTHLVLPQDTNPAGNLHGGVILKHVDITGGVVAKRHTRTNVVTVSIDRMAFKLPAYIGELLVFKASLNHVGRSSMEVGIRVEAEDLRTGEVRHTNSAYLTYVALDEKGRPTEVPSLILESDTAKRRYKEAELRREVRQRERAIEEGRTLCQENE
ncbi:acyl-CoA thioesterase [Pseudodesulfovibrio piezophilus]|uniref:Protein vdlD n=1 Tax=Pseudodesulfovibrio piezophilus (strain DSM 21447 / JCM 15486 / C1TLV30) TaxID=1322246 RepID=M1WK92_PSEP2|nr:acyl-CoA thioesterase [Pseudodesulfovibrio piezophilus]CCH49196.1 Protein vdlD [Pseudodesulfovibrio piezophilus C1TLV30]